MDYNVVLKQIRESVILKKIPRDAMGFVFSQIAGNFAKDSKNNDLIFIAKNDNEMNLIHEQLNFFSPDITQQFEILNFPAWDCLPYDRSSPKPIISSLRLKTLYRLSTRNSSQKFIIITSLNAVMQKTLASENVKNYGLFLKNNRDLSNLGFRSSIYYLLFFFKYYRNLKKHFFYFTILQSWNKF